MDIRRFPGSRRHPHLAREALETALPDAGFDYDWEPRLGGRRSLPKDEPSLDPWWEVAAFRAYAAYTRTPEFRAGLAQALSRAAGQRVAVMCSETLWWRCHRRLVADVAVLSCGVRVVHLLPSGPVEHRPSAGARLREDGLLVWDVLESLQDGRTVC